MKVEIDIESLIGDLKVSKDQMDEIRKLSVKAYIDEVKGNLITLATNRLGTSKFTYINAITITQESEYVYSLSLGGSKLANMLESGFSSFDMKIGFSQSNKAVQTKDGGWYLTIPMLFRTTNAKRNSGLPGQILPRKIYDLIRNSPSTFRETPTQNISTLKGKDIPEQFQPEAMMKLKELNSKADTYIPKSSIYAGLIRKQDKETGMSGYNTFRRVGSASDPKSWIHPGVSAYNFFEEATNTVDQIDISETALQTYFPTTTIRIPIHGQLSMEMNAKYNDMLGDMNSAIEKQIKDMLK